MKLSKRTRYGFRLMVELAKSFNDGPISIKEIAKGQNLSSKYLEQIIIQLKTVAPIKAVRGPKGGYMLSLSPSKISLKSLFDILEGSSGIVECVQEPSKCIKADGCPSRRIWKSLEDRISEAFNSTTLEDLIADCPVIESAPGSLQGPFKAAGCSNAKKAGGD
ncbi:MAG TPA: Rrf2 family transcriptional regulator [Dissulfurispiraceae bacterium]|nr:Rrf2 family transcriptional regulator [Dissulfurispiraceae bacterium]